MANGKTRITSDLYL